MEPLLQFRNDLVLQFRGFLVISGGEGIGEVPLGVFDLGFEILGLADFFFFLLPFFVELLEFRFGIGKLALKGGEPP